MSGHQVKAYPETVVLTPTHYWYIIEAASGLLSDTDQHITVSDFFANVPVPANFQANVTVQWLSIANTSFQLTQQQYTPANSSMTLGPVGSIAWDVDYLYIQTAPLQIKRVSLEMF